MKTIILVKHCVLWYRSEEFNVCRKGIEPLLGGDQPNQVRISVSRKAFKGSKRAVWSLAGDLRFSCHRVQPAYSAETWALDNGFLFYHKPTSFYIKIEPLP